MIQWYTYKHIHTMINNTTPKYNAYDNNNDNDNNNNAICNMDFRAAPSEPRGGASPPSYIYIYIYIYTHTY